MSFTKSVYHIVFGTKYRQPTIPIDVERKLYKILYDLMKNYGAFVYRIGGMPDHVHILVQLPATIAVADFVRDLKTATNVYLKDNKGSFPNFDGWAKSYCALSYSIREKDMVVNYIRNQKEHHKRVSFKDELLDLLRESGVEVDMKYFMVD